MLYSCGILHIMALIISRFMCGFALILATSAFATTVPSLSFEEMTDRSEVVAAGRVTRAWADWDKEHKYIWTHYEIAVDSTQKGRAGATVVVSEPGGVVGASAMSIAGVVGYAVGEQVAVFLQRMPNGYLRTTGWGQGKLSIDKTGYLHASSAAGIEVASVGQKAAPAGTSLRMLEHTTVGQLRALVQARVAAVGGAK
jgi:hypothetical protein